MGKARRKTEDRMRRICETPAFYLRCKFLKKGFTLPMVLILIFPRCGTTDITRTFHFGDPTDEEMVRITWYQSLAQVMQSEYMMPFKWGQNCNN